MRRYDAIVIGVSAGGMSVLSGLVPDLSAGLGMPVLITQHRAEDTDDFLASYLGARSACVVKEAVAGEVAQNGIVYLAPAGQHLVVREGRILDLSCEPRRNHARPSIDVLFESAAQAYEASLVGVLLTGANTDGVEGLGRVIKGGGLAVVQDPDTAHAETLPRHAIRSLAVHHVLAPAEIAQLLRSIACTEETQ